MLAIFTPLRLAGLRAAVRPRGLTRIAAINAFGTSGNRMFGRRPEPATKAWAAKARVAKASASRLRGPPIPLAPGRCLADDVHRIAT